jgi:hypothetical protein
MRVANNASCVEDITQNLQQKTSGFSAFAGVLAQLIIVREVADLTLSDQIGDQKM